MISVSSKMELGKDRAQAGNAAGRPILECLIDFREKISGYRWKLTIGGFGLRLSWFIFRQNNVSQFKEA